LKPDYKAQREALLREINLYKSQMKLNAENTAKDTGKKGKQALIIGGALLVTYGALQIYLTTRKTRQKKAIKKQQEVILETAPAKKESMLVKAGREYATSFLLGLASEGLKRMANGKVEKEKGEV